MTNREKQLVLTAPFTEMIAHAGYFIQMGMASIPIWMEWVMGRKYQEWRNVKRFDDGSAHAAPAGLRVLERVMVRPTRRSSSRTVRSWSASIGTSSKRRASSSTCSESSPFLVETLYGS